MAFAIYPMRINKYLAAKKIASRREVDELIVQGKVKINGRKAKLGEMISENDKVELEGDLKKLVYLAFNKPQGVVTHSPKEGETGIADILKYGGKVFPVGRLDKDSRGLIILSNDGRITDRLLNPASYHEKEYEVRVDNLITNVFIKQMSGGVSLGGGYITKKCAVEKIDDFSFSIILTEGKNRQIRRMCEVLGYEALDINRVRIMNIKLGNLKPASYRMISGEDLSGFLRDLQLENARKDSLNRL